MRIRMRIALLFIFSVFLFVACDDDDGGNDNNGIIVDGTPYELTQGFIEDYGSNGNGSFDFDVTLLSDGLVYDPVEEEVTGTGTILYLDMNTSSELGLVFGTYTFAAERDAFTIVDGAVGIEVEAVTMAGTIVELSTGEVEVSLDGGQTRMDFNLVGQGNIQITGTWVGVLTPI